MQKNLYDIGWSDKSECQACHKEEGTQKHTKAQALPLPRMVRTQTGDPRSFQKVRAKSENQKKEWKWQRGLVTHPLSESQWDRGHFSMTKWESELQRSLLVQLASGNMWLVSGAIGL